MSVEKIINEIEIDSKNEINEIINEAENKAKIIIEEQNVKIKSEIETIISNGEKKSESIKQIIISKENQKIRRNITQIKEEIIESCFSKAYEILKKFSSDEYNNFIKKIIKKGANDFGKHFSVIITRDDDENIVKKTDINIVKKIDSIGGIIIISNDGKISLDYTIEGIIKREKDRLRIEIGKILFQI